MGIGLYIIGDEILNGRRQDKHLTAVSELFAKRGWVLNWVKIVEDDIHTLINHFQHSFASEDIVFSTGGIGATPDDLTRQAVAMALNLKLEHHVEGKKILEKVFKDKLNDHRLRMVEFPIGARLIPNPVNQVPGFSIKKHHFVPGFPEMAWPMIQWVLDHEYSDIAGEEKSHHALQISGINEGELIPLMEKLLEKYSDIKVFSLPTIKKQERYLELGVKGDPNNASAAIKEIKSHLDNLNIKWK